MSMKYAVEFVGTDPLEFNAKALIPSLLTQRPPMCATNYLVIHLQYSTDLSWEKTHKKKENNSRNILLGGGNQIKILFGIKKKIK